MAQHLARSDTRTDPLPGALDMFRTLAWLEDDRRPLDWNGPANRLFTRFHDHDLQRPIIEHFERVARKQRGAIAIQEADTALTFGELWDGVSGLAETLAAETRPGELVGILLPASPMFPLAMLACLASGHPFVALDTHSPPDWLDHVLRNARTALIITLEDGLRGAEARMPSLRVIRLTGMPGSARKGWRPATMGVDEPACVLFTSGSTGRPKSIVNSQRNLLQRVAQSINAAHINTADRLVTLSSSCTIVGVRVRWSMAGCGIVAPGSAPSTSVASLSPRTSRSTVENSPGLKRGYPRLKLTPKGYPVVQRSTTSAPVTLPCPRIGMQTNFVKEETG